MLPSPQGAPVVRGRIRVAAEDFEVDEILGFEPDGHGAHALLHVEKRGANTAWVATQIARQTGAHVRDVGYCGLKDRHAVTRQWYSVPLAPSLVTDGLLAVGGDGFRVLHVQRHARKLRRGTHRGNRFRIVVRSLEGDLPGLERRLASIVQHGVPNYVGDQRFGREAANLERAREWAAGGAAPRDRAQRSFALSAARSELFNRVVAERVSGLTWNRLLPGEAVVLDGSASHFPAPQIDGVLERRCATFDVHPSAPLWGRGTSAATGDALAVEDAALTPERALRDLLESQGLQQERRATRLVAKSLAWRLDASSLELNFELPRGAFATTVLGEIVAGKVDTEGGID